jgi:hypothetical protein
MTTMKTERAVAEAALKLPRQSRAKIAEKLTLSLIDEDILVAGGKLAEARWRAYRKGTTRAKPAREALQAVVARKRKKA